jgi:undecaprenyl-diphosphatase
MASLPPTPLAARVTGAAAARHRHPPLLAPKTMTKTAPEQARETNGPSRLSGETFFARPDRALWTAGGMLALVVLIALVVPAGPLDLDRSWSEAMRHIETPLLTHLALVFNWLGRGIGRALSLTIIGLLLLRRRRWLALVAFAVAETLAPLLSTLLKSLIDRARPPDGLVHPVGASFPSGHATYAGVTCVALVLLFTTPGARRRWWWTLAGLGIAGMAWSRTYLQVHWLTDVAAGALLGSGISLLVFVIAQRHVGEALSPPRTPRAAWRRWAIRRSLLPSRPTRAAPRTSPTVCRGARHSQMMLSSETTAWRQVS